MNPDSLTPKLRLADECWAKCDMLYTVGLQRLDRIREGKDSTGKRIYLTGKATTFDIEAIEIAILNGLGLRKYLN